jgi:hypothetical protein
MRKYTVLYVINTFPCVTLYQITTTTKKLNFLKMLSLIVPSLSAPRSVHGVLPLPREQRRLCLLHLRHLLMHLPPHLRHLPPHLLGVPPHLRSLLPALVSLALLLLLSPASFLLPQQSSQFEKINNFVFNFISIPKFLYHCA